MTSYLNPSARARAGDFSIKHTHPGVLRYGEPATKHAAAWVRWRMQLDGELYRFEDAVVSGALFRAAMTNLSGI